MIELELTSMRFSIFTLSRQSEQWQWRDDILNYPAATTAPPEPIRSTGYIVVVGQIRAHITAYPSYLISFLSAGNAHQ